MRISVFGLGYVGCVSLGCLAKNGHQVTGVDISPTKVNLINKGLPTIIEKDIDLIIKEQQALGNIKATLNFQEAILETEVSILAVGTPSTPHGHLNLDYLFKIAKDFANVLPLKSEFHVIAIRSTVMPGTADKFASIIEENSDQKRDVDFAIVSNPEFLREGTAVEDYFNPPLTLIGTRNKIAGEKLISLYGTLPGEKVITDTRVSEIMKYINNTFHALKISFANEVGNICAALNIDSHKVMDIFCKDKELNISPYYLKPGFAYGGSCLPKDLKALKTLAHDLYVNTPVINNIDETNNVQIQRAVDIIVSKKRRKIGFLGLSFKAGTDDLRNSPAVALIESLLGKGFDIMIYDHNVHVSQLTGTNKEYIDQHIPHLSKLMTSDINAVINDNDVVVINNKEKEYEKVLLGHQRHDLIILDMVRINSLQSKNGYTGINW